MGALMEGIPPVCVMTPLVSNATVTVADVPSATLIESPLVVLVREPAGMVNVEMA